MNRDILPSKVESALYTSIYLQHVRCVWYCWWAVLCIPPPLHTIAPTNLMEFKRNRRSSFFRFVLFLSLLSSPSLLQHLLLLLLGLVSFCNLLYQIIYNCRTLRAWWSSTSYQACESFAHICSWTAYLEIFCTNTQCSQNMSPKKRKRSFKTCSSPWY